MPSELSPGRGARTTLYVCRRVPLRRCRTRGTSAQRSEALRVLKKTPGKKEIIGSDPRNPPATVLAAPSIGVGALQFLRCLDPVIGHLEHHIFVLLARAPKSVIHLKVDAEIPDIHSGEPLREHI